MIVSIDVGTSYSCICIKGKNGKIQPVDVATGISMYGSKYSLPTAVFLDENGKLLLGQAAMNSRKKNPENFKMEFKRLLGSDIPIFLGKENFLPEELYTHIFVHFKNCAEKISGEKIEKAYITYPAAYGKGKKERIIAAAKDAGMFDVELIDEPTAAAMSYVADGSLKENQNLMVYDFGGGTFDVSLIHYDGEGFSLLSEPMGLEQCGGIDIDRKIFKNIMSKVDSDYINQLKASKLNYMKYESQMSEMAVKAKHHLSGADVYKDDIPVGMFDLVPYSLTREEFNKMNSKLIGDTIDICRDILSEAELEISDISAVLMVGGTSRVPIVQDMVKKFAGDVPVLVAKDLELAVVSGAMGFNKNKNVKKADEPKKTENNENKKSVIESFGEETKDISNTYTEKNKEPEIKKEEESDRNIKTDKEAEINRETGIETEEKKKPEPVIFSGGKFRSTLNREPENREILKKENITKDTTGIGVKPEVNRIPEQKEKIYTGSMKRGNLLINMNKSGSLSTVGTWEKNCLMNDRKGDEITENTIVFRCPIRRKDIKTVTFVDNLYEMPRMAWDVSQKRDRSVMAWTTPHPEGRNLYIGAKGGVNGQYACEKLFSNYINLEKISFNGCFHVDYVTSFDNMFYRCISLRNVDVSDFGASHAGRITAEFIKILKA